MAYIECPELSQVFGCDVVVHATQVGVAWRRAFSAYGQVGGFVEGTEVNFAVTLNEENKPQAHESQALRFCRGISLGFEQEVSCT